MHILRTLGKLLAFVVAGALAASVFGLIIHGY
ncbi:hypothetical protein GA0071312_0325 [Saliniramus fredricksonii]|uniref:Uncharacterized protein n=1 Tax=Saliniramus fredricksonii TaxID=1653334 RepID=A0ABY0K7Y0_9HYPH|nr:hypothetical protein GA0071312_0325 [Saliniramus fredricksonii]